MLSVPLPGLGTLGLYQTGVSPRRQGKPAQNGGVMCAPQDSLFSPPCISCTLH